VRSPPGPGHRIQPCNSCQPRPCAAAPSPRATDCIRAHRPCRSQSGRRHQCRPLPSTPRVRVADSSWPATPSRSRGSCRGRSGQARPESGWRRLLKRIRTAQTPQIVSPGAQPPVSAVNVSLVGSYLTNLASQEPNKGCNYRGLTGTWRRIRSSSAAIATAEGVSECTQTVAALTGMSRPAVVVTAWSRITRSTRAAAFAGSTAS